MTRVAIIAAMDRELIPMVDGWTRRSVNYRGRPFCLFEAGDWMAVAGGIGCRRAELASRAAIEAFRPQTLMSAGLAGALVRGLSAGSVVHPDVVVDAVTGAEYRCQADGAAPGEGSLVTSDEIAGPESKARLAERFHAMVVDMEAAGVAKVAQEVGLGFHCVKAISDEFDFALPALNSFVDAEGNFQAGRFGIYAAFRPWLWPATFLLARNTSRATRALSDWLRKHLNDTLLSPDSCYTKDRTALQ